MLRGLRHASTAAVVADHAAPKVCRPERTAGPAAASRQDVWWRCLQSRGKPHRKPRPGRECGRSSGVEHNLAKVGVEGSNPFARSSLLQPKLSPPLSGPQKSPENLVD